MQIPKFVQFKQLLPHTGCSDLQDVEIASQYYPIEHPTHWFPINCVCISILQTEQVGGTLRQLPIS